MFQGEYSTKHCRQDSGFLINGWWVAHTVVEYGEAVAVGKDALGQLQGQQLRTIKPTCDLLCVLVATAVSFGNHPQYGSAMRIARGCALTCTFCCCDPRFLRPASCIVDAGSWQAVLCDAWLMRAHWHCCLVLCGVPHLHKACHSNHPAAAMQRCCYSLPAPSLDVCAVCSCVRVTLAMLRANQHCQAACVPAMLLACCI